VNLVDDFYVGSEYSSYSINLYEFKNNHVTHDSNGDNQLHPHFIRFQRLVQLLIYTLAISLLYLKSKCAHLLL
jgi:hypothetical protein